MLREVHKGMIKELYGKCFDIGMCCIGRRQQLCLGYKYCHAAIKKLSQ